MDVRCEKCQTEYELDEARLKPGGVTVKCTNCGHMFKIRKGSTTHVGVPETASTRKPASMPPGAATGSRADSIIGADTVVRPTEGGIADDRQWLLRLQNGEQKSCRELATLQQWIVAGVVTRESLISRTGKTWKRLGDIAELTQYFTIADEARKRGDRSTESSGNPTFKNVPGTLLGFGASAAGGTILPDDDDESLRSTGSYKTRPATKPPPLPAGSSTPPMGSNATDAPPAPRRPMTTPPPAPVRNPLPAQAVPQVPIPTAGNRSTGAWAADAVLPDASPSHGPAGGRVRTTSAEPAFAGRVRVMPTDESSFGNGRLDANDDDDDDMLPARRGSRGGLLLAILALLVMGGVAGVVYVFVIKKDRTEHVVTPPVADAAVVVLAPDAAIVVTPVVVTPVIDAPAAPAISALELARAELGPDLELKLRDAVTALEGNQDPGVEAVRAHLFASIAQALTDRASVTADRAEADKLRKDAKTIVLDAATSAQRAFKATPDDAAASLAMADVLRLQNKPAKDIKRYLDTARAKASADTKREVALAEALVLARDNKLDEARTAFTAIDQGEDKPETSGDVRARFQLAKIAYAQNRQTEAKSLVDQVLAAQPEHAASKALAARIETTVVKTDPLPPEDPPKDAGTDVGSAKPTGSGPTAEPGDSYDRLLAKGNTLAQKSCTRAMELFAKALEQKPNGVEALTGMGYCHIDAKQFASAFSKFRAALAVSSRYEPALWGVGEAYQQQGRKEQAIEAFKAYLEVYPGTAKAQKALDRLGGNGDPTPDPNAGSGAPTPAPTPATPPPPPAEGAGSGSG